MRSKFSVLNVTTRHTVSYGICCTKPCGTSLIHKCIIQPHQNCQIVNLIFLGIVWELKFEIFAKVIDEAVNLTSEKHDPCAQTSHLHKRRKQEYLAEGTSVELAKYPPDRKSVV